jgi:transcription antitermination factor NusG
MRIGITGSRKINDYNYIEKVMNHIKDHYQTGDIELISGGAIGVDTLCEQWAKKNGFKIKQFLPKYNEYGQRAPLVRNDLIVENSDILVAFPLLPRGSSHGTEYTIRVAEKKQLPVYVFVKEHSV